jgi:thiosulfate/3-mercaptopyruvate sulfurtransferase
MAQSDDLIDVATLGSLLSANACRVADCRSDLFDADKGERDFRSGHIPGAVHADMDRDLAGAITPASGRHPLPDPDIFRDWLESSGIGDETRVVAYDYGNGALAARLWWMLREWLGHPRVSVLDGGVAAWIAAGQRLETEAVIHPRASFTSLPDRSVVATTAEIAAALAAGRSQILLDARDPARFRGEHEPIDAVAGHVPGARNVPLGLSLKDDGSWREPPELTALWRGIVPEKGGERPIVMCGSGVTACHLIVSARVAGVTPPRLYVGSWSEWIRDPGRPVAVGE